MTHNEEKKQSISIDPDIVVPEDGISRQGLFFFFFWHGIGLQFIIKQKSKLPEHEI